MITSGTFSADRCPLSQSHFCRSTLQPSLPMRKGSTGNAEDPDGIPADDSTPAYRLPRCLTAFSSAAALLSDWELVRRSEPEHFGASDPKWVSRAKSGGSGFPLHLRPATPNACMGFECPCRSDATEWFELGEVLLAFSPPVFVAGCPRERSICISTSFR